MHSTGAAGWFVALGRAGLAARGVVYVVVGALAAMAAFGIAGGKVLDQKEAVRAIGDSAFGNIALWVIGAGLVSYALWRFAQAAHVGTNEDNKPGKRIIALISGVAYAGLAMTALAQAIGSSTSSSSNDSKAAWLMSQPFGRWLVAGVGAAVIAAALFQFYQAFTEKFARKLSGHELTGDRERWSRFAGRLGYSARGVAFGLIGWFFVQAAMQSDASEAGGLSVALRTVSSQPHGDLLLGAVATGLALFGVYSVIEARYRRIS